MVGGPLAQVVGASSGQVVGDPLAHVSCVAAAARASLLHPASLELCLAAAVDQRNAAVPLEGSTGWVVWQLAGWRPLGGRPAFPDRQGCPQLQLIHLKLQLSDQGLE